VPTDHWIVHCHPSATTTCAEADDWGDELRLTDTSFEVEQLPFARGPFGYFVVEYQGLTSTGNTFRPLCAIGTGNRLTDIVTATAGREVAESPTWDIPAVSARRACPSINASKPRGRPDSQPAAARPHASSRSR
jgi:hypothetical protein